jgi:hypothetical protein
VPCGVIGKESAEVGLANPLAQAARYYAENHLEDCASNAGDNCTAEPIGMMSISESRRQLGYIGDKKCFGCLFFIKYGKQLVSSIQSL